MFYYINEILLLINFICAVICSIYITKQKNTDCLGLELINTCFKKFIQNIMLCGIWCPILEELLFREAIYGLTKHWGIYAKIFNVILFSIMHLSNIIIWSKILAIGQMIFSIYLGYYLLTLENIYYRDPAIIGRGVLYNKYNLIMKGIYILTIL